LLSDPEFAPRRPSVKCTQLVHSAPSCSTLANRCLRKRWSLRLYDSLLKHVVVASAATNTGDFNYIWLVLR
jgi:hypothetical protein